MSDLTEFLLARIAEDEAVASVPPNVTVLSGDHFERPWRAAFGEHTCEMGELFLYIDPARVLADVEAKRRIVESEGAPYPAGHTPPTRTLRLLASVYSDHPDYDPSWRTD